MDAAPLVKLEAESEPAETRGRLKMDAGAGSGPMGDSYTRDANDGNVPCSTAADMEDLDHSSAKAEDRYTTPPKDSAYLPTPGGFSPDSSRPRCDQLEYVARLEADMRRSRESMDKTPPRSDCSSTPRSPTLASSSRATGLYTPAETPVASTSTLPPLDVPTGTPTSRQSKRKLIPLERLIPAGTILLRDHQVVEPEGDHARDPSSKEWHPLVKTSLRCVKVETEEPPDTIESDPSVSAHAEMSAAGAYRAPALSSKRKRSGSKAGRSKKRSKPAVPAARSSDSLLSVIVHCQDAVLLRCTYMPLDDSTVALRVYLVPEDIDELDDDGFTLGKRARPADSVVLQVLASVHCDEREWDGEAGDEGAKSLMDEEDQRSILELYRAVASPRDDPFHVDSLAADDWVKDRIAAVLTEDQAGSMLTELYPYQKASLAKMLQREIAPQYTVDPSYIYRESAINGENFWITVEGDVAVDPPRCLEPPSGILAEDMGAGKTAICLALVLATMRELPTLDDTITFLDGTGGPPPKLMTHRSRLFPFQKEILLERELLPRVPPPILPQAEMDAREWARYVEQLEWQAQQDTKQARPPLPSLRSLLIDYVRTSPVAIRYERESMPPGLVEDLDDTTPYYHLFPSPSQLATRSGRNGFAQPTKIVVSAATLVVVPTDLVRQWTDELQKHVDPKANLQVLVLRTKSDGFRTAEQLARYDLVLLSVARFSDAADDPYSPLLKVHWRRLIVDEGHTLSSANRLRDLAEQLRCQSRWAISGTPSTNLRSAVAANEGALLAHDSSAGGSEKDFQRLGQLFSRFIRHPAIKKPEDFRRIFTDPIHKSGRGAARLAALLDAAIVRNDASRVRSAYTLPPLTKSVVEIVQNEAERKTYNALVAIYSANAISSQRVDEDYLFHPSKRRFLDELSTNFAASSFFFASNKLTYWLKHAIENSKEDLASEKKSGSWSEEDRRGLEKAIAVMGEALADTEWVSIVDSATINIEVDGIDDEVLQLFHGQPANINPRRKAIAPLGSLVTMLRDLKELRKADLASWKDSDDLREELLTFELKRQREAAMPKPTKVEVAAAAAAAAADPMMKPKPRKKKGEEDVFLPLPADSSFRRVTLGLTSSAKLNYVISQLKAYPDDKFIIFSSSLPDLVFACLSEALDLLSIKHLIFASNGKDRGSIAATFNSTSAAECQAVLVDARLGGRGICLTTASRVIMLEPIWLPDLEVQAAKRAHRLGQTRPVDLQILVVPGSYEHAMLQRRSQLDPTYFSRTKQPQRDSQLSDLLQAARYLEPSSQSSQHSYAKTLLIDPAADAPPSPSLLSAKSGRPPAVASPKKRPAPKAVPASPAPRSKKPKKTVAFAV